MKHRISFTRVIALALALTLSCIAPASAANPLVGTWASTLNWENQSAGLLYSLQITADGHLHQHVMNHVGMAYDLFGTYRFDGKTLTWKWTDYAPKKLCLPGVPCTALPVPEPLGISHSARITFRNAKFFVGTGSDGSSMNWIRN